MSLKTKNRLTVIAVLSVLAFALGLTVLVRGDGARFGDLTRESRIVTEGTYPLFWIPIPDGCTEVQIRASTNNFQESVRFHRGGGPDMIFKCTGTHAGRNYYELDGMTAQWDAEDARWEFNTDSTVVSNNGNNVTLPALVYSESDVEFPWLATGWVALNPDGSPNNERAYTTFKTESDDKFCYRWCSTGEDADPTWGTGVQDGNAIVFIADQAGSSGEPLVPNGNPHELRELISGTEAAAAAGLLGTEMTAQILNTPGRFIIFQPSRDVENVDEWMNLSNTTLQWQAQFEHPENGVDTHTDGTPLWSPIRPVEWRTSRMTLQANK